MKIAVLYICTGKYDIFWPSFYDSCEKYFCTDFSKHYFVFTDSKFIQPSRNVTTIFQESLGWPFNTMYRYHMFLRIKEYLEQYNFSVFFNANAIFMKKILFTDFFGNNFDLVGAVHPGYIDKPEHSWPFEQRPISTASTSKKMKYFQGAINGGKTSAFISITEELSKNIDTDLKNGIVALWHDESHWNAYLNNNYEKIKGKINILPPSYIYPEGGKLPFEKIIILRDKKMYGGHNLLRGIKEKDTPLLNRIKEKLSNLLRNR